MPRNINVQFSCLGYEGGRRLVAGCCAHGNEPLGFLRASEFLLTLLLLEPFSPTGT